LHEHGTEQVQASEIEPVIFQDFDATVSAGCASLDDGTAAAPCGPLLFEGTTLCFAMK
jgi:hypothetical protein